MRERGHRAVLVAHPAGVLFRRASEGDDLVPLSPRSEVDLASAWRLSRIIGSFRPDVVHAHDPHAVAMASMALSFGSRTAGVRLVASRRVDFRLQRHSFSRWKYRQVERFIAASAAIRDILVSDGIPAARIDVVHDGIDVERVAKVPAGDIHQTFWFPQGRAGGGERRRPGRVTRARSSSSTRWRRCAARCPTPSWSSSAKAICASRSPGRSATSGSTSTSSWPASATTSTPSPAAPTCS